MARYLVTGGLGFIGSHLVSSLLANGHQIKIIDDGSTAVVGEPPSPVELIAADIRDSEVVARTLGGVDGCFHLAAIASVVRCNEDWWRSHTVNLGASVALFEQAAITQIPVVYASSAAIYGDNPSIPINESEPADPLAPYGADKAAMEVQARMGAAIHGLSSIGLRFFNVYGPRQSADNPYAGVITKFCRCVAQGEPLSVNGDGSQSRDFVHFGDVVHALMLAMQRLSTEAPEGTAEVFNVCTGRATSVADLAVQLIKLANANLSVNHGPPRTGDIAHSIGDPTRAKTVLGFEAKTPLVEGLASLIR